MLVWMHLCKYVVFMMSLNDFQHFDEIASDCDTSNELPVNVRTRIVLKLQVEVFKSGLLLHTSYCFLSLTRLFLRTATYF